MGATLMAIRAVLGLDDSEYSKGLQNAERQGKKTVIIQSYLLPRSVYFQKSLSITL